jgi:hypothetical protein
LLGTSALVAFAAPAVSADTTIAVNTMANQVLNDGDTLTVNPGIVLNPGTRPAMATPIVTIIGSNTRLTNNGKIILAPKIGGSNAVNISGAFQPHGRVGWTEQIALDDRQVRLSVAGVGANLDLEDGDEGTLTVGVGLDVIFTPGIRATLGFDGAYGAARNRSSAFAGVSLDLP